MFTPTYKVRRKKVFVSFDYENDRRYKYLLEAWDANPDFEFVFTDLTSDEIQTNNIGRIKAGLTAKINLSTHTLVIVGKFANSWHKDWKEIGFKNWINFEVHQSKENNNKIIAVKLDTTYAEPDEFSGYLISRVYGFDHDPIVNALEAA